MRRRELCSDASRRSSSCESGGDCPVATVVISGNGEGDRAVESPEVKVSARIQRTSPSNWVVLIISMWPVKASCARP
jgi:hypothetical protein